MRGQNGVKNQKVVIFLPRLLAVSLLLHEGAPTLIGRFIADGSVDELFLTVAFQVAGRNAGAANCSNNTSLQDEGHRPMAISSARA
jgi:riboflavin biosynthesis pyrimidine reductase